MYRRVLSRLQALEGGRKVVRIETPTLTPRSLDEVTVLWGNASQEDVQRFRCSVQVVHPGGVMKFSPREVKDIMQGRGKFADLPELF